jgi:calpain-15
VNEYIQLKETFIDPDFPHSNSSLYINPYKPKSKWQMQISGWGRPSQARGSWLDRGNGNWCIYSNPKPSDIAQGALGNCWFLSGLAVVAEIPDLLQQLVITKEVIVSIARCLMHNIHIVVSTGCVFSEVMS